MFEMRISVLATALIAIATAAQAADMPAQLYTKAPPAHEGFTWTGIYFGGHGGYGWSKADVANINGGFGGGQVGANYQTGNLVFGLEADVSGGSIDGSVNASAFRIPGTVSTKIDSFGTVRGRVGYAIDRTLIYGTGGFAWVHNKVSASVLGFNLSADNTHTGWAAGAGVEYALDRNWTGKIEYVFTTFGSETYDFGIVSVPSGRIGVGTVKLGVNYLFH